MAKKSFITLILVIGLCFSFAVTSHSATIINITAEGALADVQAFQVSVQAPNTANVSTWTNSFPAGWLDLTDANAKPKIVSAFSLLTENFLPTGRVGEFSDNVELGGWVLGNSENEDLKEGVNFFVRFNEVQSAGLTTAATDYVYDIVVPIPSAIFLLGGGLISLFTVLRRRRS
jgi:hypothetical protein